MKRSKMVAALVEGILATDEQYYAGQAMCRRADEQATRIDKRVRKLGLTAETQYELNRRRRIR